MILKIKTNNIHIKEKKYILDVLFVDILKLKIKYEYTSENIFEIILPNNKKIVIPDIFFDLYKNEKEWTKYNYPQSCFNTTIDLENKHNLFGIYGTKDILLDNHHISIGNDIIGTAFVFLARLEELNNNQDKFNRYQYKNSLAYRFDIITRPIVNEYINFFKEVIKLLCPGFEFKKYKFNTLLTHDIDTIRKWTFRYLLKHTIINFGKPNFFKGYKDFLQSRFNYYNDPYYNFEDIMNISESKNLSSLFLFMALKKNEFDFRYSLNRVLPVLKKIKSNKKHKFGIHISKLAYNNLENCTKEIHRLSELTNSEIYYSRQHYLMFDPKKTWSILDTNGIKYDLSLGYPERPGFRCGICYPFHVFDIVKKIKLNLIEIPLIVMDTSLFSYLKNQKFDNELNVILENVKKYNGTLNLLLHNDQFDYSVSKNSNFLFDRLIE